VTVLASSKGSETSEERDAWGHGAFTKALLDSFNDPAADTNRNGLISTTGLATYLNRRVPTQTDGKQRWGSDGSRIAASRRFSRPRPPSKTGVSGGGSRWFSSSAPIRTGTAPAERTGLEAGRIVRLGHGAKPASPFPLGRALQAGCRQPGG
jgi:hypothetical protein